MSDKFKPITDTETAQIEQQLSTMGDLAPLIERLLHTSDRYDERPSIYDREGLPPMRDMPKYMRNREQFRRSITDEGESGWRSRRLYICRAAGDIDSIIDALPIDQLKRNELGNLNAILLRMILLENDGRVSSSKLNRF